jgi:hypothetical protein
MICQLFLLFWVIQGTHLGLGLGLPEDNPPTGLLTKTQPNPRVGFWWAGLGGGRVLARPSYHQLLDFALCFLWVSMAHGFTHESVITEITIVIQPMLHRTPFQIVYITVIWSKPDPRFWQIQIPDPTLAKR